MDKARKGKFQSPPRRYPAGAWYTYNDKTCSYDCMAFEYFYWVLTSMLGAQKARMDAIGNEWRLITRESVRSRDPAAWSIFTNPKYRLPTRLPTGTYSVQDQDPCASGVRPTTVQPGPKPTVVVPGPEPTVVVPSPEPTVGPVTLPGPSRPLTKEQRERGIEIMDLFGEMLELMLDP